MKAQSCDAASGDIKPGGNAYKVEVVVGPILEFNAGLIKLNNRVVLGIDNFDTIAVELFEIGVFQAGTLDTPGMRWLDRGEYLAVVLVLPSSALLLLAEVINSAIGLWIKEVVFVVPKPVSKASIVSQSLEELLTFFKRVFECLLLGQRVEEWAKAAFTKIEKFRIPHFPSPLLFSCESSKGHRHGQVRGPLEDFELARDRTPRLSDLDC